MSSLDFARPTFFSCLGVLVYLTREAVDAVFRLVASFPAGSEIAFTFSSETTVVADLAQGARAVGEPWLTHFDPQAQRDDLRKLGFSQVTVLSPAEADRRYYQNRSDGLPAPRRASIAAAIVGEAESPS
jgi:O-methyltransferase involved in polyketide biosynthesis